MRDNEQDHSWGRDLSVALVRPDGPHSYVDDDEPWLEEASGTDGRHRRGRRSAVIARGEDAVRAAVSALTGQIAVVAGEVARGLDSQGLVEANPGQMGVDSVEVSFGVTLTAGSGQAIEAILAVEGEAAVQVTVSLTRRPSPESTVPSAP